MIKTTKKGKEVSFTGYLEREGWMGTGMGHREETEKPGKVPFLDLGGSHRVFTQ